MKTGEKLMRHVQNSRSFSSVVEKTPVKFFQLLKSEIEFLIQALDDVKKKEKVS